MTTVTGISGTATGVLGCVGDTSADDDRTGTNTLTGASGTETGILGGCPGGTVVGGGNGTIGTGTGTSTVTGVSGTTTGVPGWMGDIILGTGTGAGMNAVPGESGNRTGILGDCPGDTAVGEDNGTIGMGTDAGTGIRVTTTVTGESCNGTLGVSPEGTLTGGKNGIIVADGGIDTATSVSGTGTEILGNSPGNKVVGTIGTGMIIVTGENGTGTEILGV
jgi:hypothetical protein